LVLLKQLSVIKILFLPTTFWEVMATTFGFPPLQVAKAQTSDSISFSVKER